MSASLTPTRRTSVKAARKTARGPALLEVLKNRFQAVVDEMGFVLLRTGHTVFIKETGDFSTALVTPVGEVFCAPTRIGMIRIVGMNAGVALEATRPWKQGDVFITNDPWTTGGMCTHLPDLFLWKPVFVRGRLICFAMDFIHVSDIGGRVPGSISPTASEIYEEGLVLPPSYLYRQGTLSRELVNIILANCRIPEQTWGDIKAALAAIEVGERRVQEMVQRYGTETIEWGMGALLEAAEKRAREIFRQVPDGAYHFSDYMEGAPPDEVPFRLAMTLTFRNGEVTMDFTGTDAQVTSAFNIPTQGRYPHHFLSTGVVTFVKSMDPAIPYNSGIVRPLRMVLPEGSIVNPHRGAAVGVRAATMHRVYDLTMGCLAQALPRVIPAAGAGQGAILMVAVPKKEGGLKVSVVQPLRGGSGGRSHKDGVEGNDIAVGSGRNIPNEVIEHEMPLLIHRYSLRPGSAGPGRFRGGNGLLLDFELLAEEGIVTCRGLERYRFRPWGRLGGRPGTTGFTQLNDAIDEGRFDVLRIRRGDRLQFGTQGGAGYGDPFEREPERILRDVLEDRIAPEQAEEYGVVIRDGKVDAAATAALRSSPRPAVADFDLGSERREFEASPAGGKR